MSTATAVPCFHVTTNAGSVFGVAATSKRDALQMVADRLTREGHDDAPKTATPQGTWGADYGTVLWYS